MSRRCTADWSNIDRQSGRDGDSEVADMVDIQEMMTSTIVHSS